MSYDRLIDKCFFFCRGKQLLSHFVYFTYRTKLLRYILSYGTYVLTLDECYPFLHKASTNEN